MEEILVFGHRKPDTDSVASAIAFSYLKNKLYPNIKATPRILGDINNETKFVLDYFKIETPKYLNDVRLQMSNVNYRKNFMIHQKKSIYDSYQYMMQNNSTAVPVVEDNKNLVGLVTLKMIAREMIDGDFDRLNTSYQNIVDTLSGTQLLKFDDEICGNILVASYKSTTFLNQISLDENTILIVGDRHSILEYAVNSKVKMIVLTGNCEIKEEHLKIAIANKVNIIMTPYLTFNVARMICLSNYITKVITSEVPVTIQKNDYLDTFLELSKKHKYTNFPVVDKKGKCLGLVRITDIHDTKRKKVVLVDHNEKSQSIEGLNEADIVEVIDHHKLGDITTSMPINFRNMAVGSTNTIIFHMYEENKIEIPKDIAGIMLSGILSDTLMLKSPTTTVSDRLAVQKLSEMIEIDYESYGLEMFKAGSSLKGKTIEGILYTDSKVFQVEENSICISQIFTTDFQEIEKDIHGFVERMDEIASNNHYIVFALFVTNVITEGSYIIYSNCSKKILEDSFGISDLGQGTYLKGIVSRKKQIIPSILEILEKK